MIPILSKIANRFRSQPKNEESGDDVSYTIKIDDVGYITTNTSSIQIKDSKLGIVNYVYEDTYVYDLSDESDLEDFKKETANDGVSDYSICIETLNGYISKYMDFYIGHFDEHVLLQSELRGICIILKNFLFFLDEMPVEAVARLNMLSSLISDTDNNYVIESRAHADGKMYLKLFKDSYDKLIHERFNKKVIETKRAAKNAAKKSCKFKYYVGDRYSVWNVDTRTNELIESVYEVKKTIYTIGANQVNVVVMKFISGVRRNMRPVSPLDCNAFHIKYEPDLFIFPMNARLIKKSVKL